MPQTNGPLTARPIEAGGGAMVAAEDLYRRYGEGEAAVDAVA